MQQYYVMPQCFITMNCSRTTRCDVMMCHDIVMAVKTWAFVAIHTHKSVHTVHSIGAPLISNRPEGYTFIQCADACILSLMQTQQDAYTIAIPLRPPPPSRPPVAPTCPPSLNHTVLCTWACAKCPSKATVTPPSVPIPPSSLGLYCLSIPMPKACEVLCSY